MFSGALDDDRVRLHAHMAVYFDTIGRIDMASVLGLPKWWPSLSAIKARPSIAFFRGVVNRVVSAREAEDRQEAVDLLDRLMRAPDPQSGRTLATQAVVDNVLTFLSAGHETTGNALAWILYLLSLFPDVERRVRDELSGLTSGAPGRKDIEQLVFTRAVIDEAMRLYPPAPFIARVALEADELAGESIAKGTEIVISPWIAHRRRATWEEPDRFRPGRFLPGAEEKPRGAFIPFGLGPRICIGQGFALQEIVIVLARVLPAFRFALEAPEKVFPLARITLQPEGGMWMRVRGA
jgi:cytochrome P450